MGKEQLRSLGKQIEESTAKRVAEVESIAEDRQRLVAEACTHQAELEKQREQLRLLQAELQDDRSKLEEHQRLFEGQADLENQRGKLRVLQVEVQDDISKLQEQRSLQEEQAMELARAAEECVRFASEARSQRA